MQHAGITMRSAQPADELFLLELRNITMTEHLERVGDPTDRETHLERVRVHYEHADIICDDGSAIGMLKVQRGADDWVLVQIQLIPSYQRRGIGTRLLHALLTEAQLKQIHISLSVLKGNPARLLYERLGFRLISETDRDVTLAWYPKRT